MKSIVLFALVAVAYARAAPAEEIPIVRQDSDVQPDGSYSYAYETGNGITAEEKGTVKSGAEGPFIAADGKFSYKSPEGEAVLITYVADEYGFQPQGSHIPTPPPVPKAIQRALEWIAAHPEPSRK